MIYKDIDVGDEIYIRFWIKVANSWPNYAGTKFLRTINNTSVSNQTEFWLGLCNWWISGHTYENGGAGSLKQWDTGLSAGKNFGLKGNWVKVEIYMKKNSSGGTYDGIFKIWWNNIEVYSNSSYSFWRNFNLWYNRFYFPSNMNCDPDHIESCCGGTTDRAGAIIYYDDIEIWSGMPSDAAKGSIAEVFPPPGGLKVVSPVKQ